MTHFRTCNLCEAMCGLAIETEGERILSIRGDDDDAFSRGHICPKAVALQDLHEDPDRLREPMRRRGDRWETISWDQALDEIADRITALQKQHGHDSIATYAGNPIAHNYGALLFIALFIETLKTRSRYSSNSCDALPHLLAGYLVFGHQALLPVPDLDRTEYFLVLGANPVVSNGSLMSAPGVARRLQELRARGGKLVVLDPRRTETAELADRHLFIRPGSDALFLFALVHTLFDEKLTKPGRLAAFTSGLAEVEAAAAGFSPEAVAGKVGIPAGEIRGLAREFAAAERACCYGRLGVSTQQFGGLACWLLHVVNLLTGNLDREGGSMFTRPALDTVDVATKIGQKGSYDSFRTRVRGLPEFGGELPAATLAEEIETPGEGQVRGLVVFAGNPVLSVPGGSRLERALGQLDLLVAIDLYRNETSRHAHYILPPTSQLERDHFDMLFNMMAVRNVVKYSPPLFAPPPGAKHDWQILLDLSRRLAARRSWLAAQVGAASRAVMGRLGPDGLVNIGLRYGPYGQSFGRGLSMKKLKAAPHGIDLGPLLPCLPGRLETRGRRIQLAPAPMLADAARLAAHLGAPAVELSLIGRRDLRSNNSWMHNAARLVKGEPRCTLLMHPSDAAARGLSHGQTVRVTSQVGAVEAPLEVSAEVMPGVVSLPHGWGHARPGPPTEQRVADAHSGVSANDLSDDRRVDPLVGTAAFSALPVSVTAA